MKKTHAFFLLAALAVGVAAGALVWTWSHGKLAPPPELEAALLTQPQAIAPFRLTDQDGVSFGPERFHGRWSLLFFGYTHCPDICPTTLITLNGVAKRLEQEPNGLNDTQFLFVSVDPKRDSPAHLKTYLAYFHPAFRGATGERAQIDALVNQSGAVYMFEGDTTKEDYIVNHSATLYVVDPEGRLYARLLPPHEPGEIVNTLARLRRFYHQQ